MTSASPDAPHRSIGRYALYDEIASGGMATVHLGRLSGPAGFARTVAIKRLHPQFAKDPEFVSMFFDEARLAARIVHPNVVSILDVVALEGELFLVMDYVQGESMSRLWRNAKKKGIRVPTRITLSVATGLLYGLHAAHEAKNERGEPLGIVHRDVTPQNVLVGVDGVARVLDFGVAKAAGRAYTTRDGLLKGKLPYMAPEQLRFGTCDRRTDVYSASVVLWESLTGRRLFDAETEGETFGMILNSTIDPPSKHVPLLPTPLDEVVLRGLASEPNARFSTAKEMAVALERALTPATPREVGEWVELNAGDILRLRAAKVAEVESISSIGPGPSAAKAPVPTTGPAEPPSWPQTSPGVTRSSHPDKRSVNQPLLIIVAVAVALVLVGLFALLLTANWKSSPARSASSVAAPAGSLLPVASSAAPTAEQADASAALSSSEESAVPNTGLPDSSPVPPVTASAIAATPTSSVRPTKPPPPVGGVRPGCNPPYTLDAKGFHVMKPECL